MATHTHGINVPVPNARALKLPAGSYATYPPPRSQNSMRTTKMISTNTVTSSFTYGDPVDLCTERDRRDRRPAERLPRRNQDGAGDGGRGLVPDGRDGDL